MFKKIATGILGVLMAYTGYAQPLQNCNFEIKPHNVTCNGGADGSAEIWKDGKLVEITTTNGPCPGSCVTTLEPSPIVCGGTVPQGSVPNGQTSGTVWIKDNQTVYMTAASFTGDLKFEGAGGKLIICYVANINNVNFNSINANAAMEIIVNGTANVSGPSLQMHQQLTLRNYGTLNFTSSIGFLGKLFNYKDINATNGTLSIDAAPAQLYNSGTIKVLGPNGGFNNKNLTTNYGKIEVTGDFNTNGGSGLINYCTITVSNNMHIDNPVDNYGMITVGLEIQQKALYTGRAGSLLKSNSMIIEALMNGAGSSCASVKVAQKTILNGSGIVQGNLDLCSLGGITYSGGKVLPPASTNCSCVPGNGSSTCPSQGPNATVTWNTNNIGTVILNGAAITNLTTQNATSKTYTVTIAYQGCSTVTKSFTITQPATALTATVAISAFKATISATGGNDIDYTYVWSDGVTSKNKERTFTSCTDLTVTVQDSKGCSSLPKQVKIENCPGNVCVVKVSYNTNGTITINATKVGNSYVLTTGIPVSTILKRPCADSTINIVNCEQEVSTLKLQGKGGVCETDVHCPDPNNPLCAQCPDPNNYICEQGCPDPNSPACCNKQIKPDCGGGDPDFEATVSTTPPSCGKGGTATISVPVGRQYYTFNGVNNQHDLVVTGLPVGKTVITVRDLKTGKQTYVTADVAPAPVSNLVLVNAADPVVAINSSFTLSISNAVSGPYSISLGKLFPYKQENLVANGSTLVVGPYNIPDNLGNGPFKVELTDASCKIYSFDVYRRKPVCPTIPSFVPVVTRTVPSYLGKSDGSLTITNLPANVKALWSVPGRLDYVVGATLPGIPSGTYPLILKSANVNEDCFVAQSLEILGVPPNIEVGSIEVDANCKYRIQYVRRNADGSINTNPLPTPVKYTWTNPVNGDILSTAQDFEVSKHVLYGKPSFLKIEVLDGQGNLGKGLFSIPAKCPLRECDPLLDPNCCPGGKNCVVICDPITDPLCPELKITYLATPPACNQGGKVVFTIGNGSGDFSTRNLINDQTGTTITGLPAGNHQVWIKDNQSLKLSSILVKVPEAPKTVLKLQNNTDPIIADNNAFTLVLDQAFAGPYSVTLQNIAPYDQRDIAVGASGHLVLGPYSLPTQLGNGPFLVTVTDANCQNYPVRVYRRICFVQNIAFSPQVSLTKPSYLGAFDGSLILSNAPANAVVEWTGSTFTGIRTGSTLSGIPAGSYYLTVKDQTTGCLYYEGGTKAVEVPEGYSLEPIVQVGVNCNFTLAAVLQNADGSQNTLTPSIVSYKWSIYPSGTVLGTTSSLNIQTLLLAGKPKSIVVEVKMANGLTGRDVWSIPDACYPIVEECPVSLEYEFRAPTCAEAIISDGYIRIKSATGSVRWVTPALAATDPYGWFKGSLGQGDYELLVKVSETCFKTYPISLKAPAPLVLSHEELSPIGVKVTVAQGTGPYVFQWEGQAPITTADPFVSRTDLIPGVTYKIDVTDNKNCKQQYSFTYSPCAVSKPVPYVVYRQATDEVIVIPNGGTFPYDYFWDNTSATTPAEELIDPYGDTKTGLQNNKNYNIIVTDAKGCTGSTTFLKNITNICIFDVTITTTPVTAGNICDATATVSIPGVTDLSAYTIIWDEYNIIDLLKKKDGLRALQKDSKVYIINVCSGPHEVFVKNTGPNSCALIKKFYVADKPKQEVNCNLSTLRIEVPGSSTFTMPCGSTGIDMNFSVFGGRQTYQYDWTYAQGSPTTAVKVKSDKSGYTLAQVGDYQVKVTDADGCTKTQDFKVLGSQSNAKASAKSGPPTCVNGKGTVIVTLLNAQAGETITWTDNTSLHDLLRNDVLGGQTYYYTLKDGSGCVLGKKSIYVDPYIIESQSYATRDSLCAGQTVDLVAKYNPSYNFIWSAVGQTLTNPQADVVTVAQAGTYTITYTHKTNPSSCPQWTEQIVIGNKVKGCTTVSQECKVYDYELPEPSDTNSCELAARMAAEATGLKNYSDYIEKIKQDFSRNYISSVMGSLKETLEVSFNDQEHHYTLYYYDQAGNLVRTVPPAGLGKLNNEDTKKVTDYWENTLAGTAATLPSVNTQHTLATTYTYNSLNQLVAQDMPDHRQQDLWEAQNSFLLPDGLTLSTLDANGNKVLLFANTTGANPEAKLYSSTDLGKTFNPVQNIGVGKILDLQRAGATGAVYYAVGEQGTLLKALNGPSEWFLLASPTDKNIIKVHFTGTDNGLIINESAEIWRTDNGGTGWVPATTNLSLGTGVTIKQVNVIDDNIYVTTSANEIWLATVAALNFARYEFKAPALTTAYSVAGVTYLAGPPGSVFKIQGSKLILQGKNNLTEDIKQIVTNGTLYLAKTSSNSNLYTSTDGKTYSAVALTNASSATLLNDNGNIVVLNGTSILYRLSSTGLSPSTSFTGGNVVSYAKDGTNEYIGLSNASLIVNTVTYSLSGANIYSFSKLAVIGGNLLALNGTSLSAAKLVAPVAPATTGTATVIGTAVNNISNLLRVNGTWYALNTSNQVLSITLTATTFSVGASIVTLPTSTRDLSFAAAVGNTYTYVDNTGNAVGVVAGTSTYTNNLMSPGTLAGVAKGQDQAIFAGGQKGQLFKFGNSLWEYNALPTLDEDLTLMTTELNNDVPKLRASSSNKKLYTFGLNYGAYTTASYALENITGSSTQIFDDPIVALSYRYLLTQAGKVYTFTGTVWQLDESFVTSTNFVSLNGNVLNAALPLAGGAAGAIRYKAGSVWTASSPVKVQAINDVAFDGDITLAVGQKGTLLKSTNFGTTWAPKFTKVSNSDFSAVGIKGTTAVAGTTDNKLAYSTNTGDTWTTITLPAVTASPVETAVVKSIAIPAQNIVWVVRGRTLYYSSNGGATLTQALKATQELNSISIDASGYGFLVGEAGTAYRIQPTTSFTTDQIGTGALVTLNSTYSALKIVPDGDILDDKGTGIPQVQSLKTVRFTDRLVGYLTTGSGLILKSIDGGYHWKRENSSTSNPNTQITFGDAQHGVMSNGNQVSTLRDRAQQLGTRYWYDELGRLILSQNSKQYNIQNYLSEQQYADVGTALALLTNPSTANNPTRAYSYTLYDPIGRISEVGEFVTKETVPYRLVESKVLYDTYTTSFLIKTKGVKQQITRTFYDVASIKVSDFDQENLRPRVACVTYSDRDVSNSQFDRATLYSYDIHGNVKDLKQIIRK